ncbi:MAG: cyanophycinase [Saprospiraceae bacterium]|nr:cyanophycinase [Saprospiraceae bacterium]WKZ63385.1 MAG: cyanophycinase [Saprospiraceae bacterium]
MYNKIIISFLTLFLCLDLTSQSISEEGKLFIIGGGRKPASMIQRMVKEANFKQGDYAMILPMASGAPHSAINEMKKALAESGIMECYGINFDQSMIKDPIKLDSVKNARLIFLSGGDQNRFMHLVLNSPLEQAIKDALSNGALIAGTSAGAAMMSKYMITGNQFQDTVYTATFKNIIAENVEIAMGLGLLVNAIVDQHFLIRSRHNRLLTAICEYPGNTGIGIDESTALLVKGNIGTVVGESQVLVYRLDSRPKVGKNGKFSVPNIRTEIYTEGDSFKIK